MIAFAASFIFILLAEMGDKTQLLAMAFAAKYKPKDVLIAIFFATLANHALAVLAGHFLTTTLPLNFITLIASLSFIGFGLWTLKGDTLQGEDSRPSRFGPLLTVGLAFFLAEIGDKTQLSTISLAIHYQNMLAVLSGTTLAMVAADAIGIMAGVILHKNLPEKTIKFVSAAIFILFGLYGIYNVLTQAKGGL